MESTQQTAAKQTQGIPPCSLWQLVRYFLKLGTLGFGGPVALVGYMHRDLVEQRKWISEMDYQEGLALAQLSPGPLAAQPAVLAFIKGVTIAAIGAITGAVVVLGRRTITDIPTTILALLTLVLLWRWKKLPEPLIVVSAAIIGLVVYSALHH